MIAPWPEANPAHQDDETEARFSVFQKTLAAVREIRARQNLGKNPVNFYLRADEATCELLQPMMSYFQALANATAVDSGPSVSPPETCAHVNLKEFDVFVDLAGLIDTTAEVGRLEQQQKKLNGLIQGKEKKLANANFAERAPRDVVERERESLAQLQTQLQRVQDDLDRFR